MSEPYEAKTAEAQAAAIRHRRTGLEAMVSQPESEATLEYAGLATRTIAFALDAALVSGIASLVGVTIGLALSVLHLSERAKEISAVLAGAAWVLWSVSYFAFFWSSTGQTPGNRLMRIRVLDYRERGPLRPLRAAARFGFLILAALPLCAGLLIMLWDSKRRCLQDRLARTVVVYAPAEEPGEAPRMVRSG